jgi:hypothetical protein
VDARAAAAILVLAVGANVANLDLRVGNVAVRTGRYQVPQVATAPSPRVQTGPVITPADLEAVKQQLRGEFAQQIASAAASGATPSAPAASRNTAAPTTRLSPDDFRQVQTLVDDMARRKQHEFDQQLAERFLRFTRDMNSQRAAELQTIQQGLSQMDFRTSELGRVQNYMLRAVNVQQIK